MEYKTVRWGIYSGWIKITPRSGQWFREMYCPFMDMYDEEDMKKEYWCRAINFARERFGEYCLIEPEPIGFTEYGIPKYVPIS